MDSVSSGTSTGPSCSSYCSDTRCSITACLENVEMLGVGPLGPAGHPDDRPVKTSKASLPNPRSSPETIAIITSTKTMTTVK